MLRPFKIYVFVVFITLFCLAKSAPQATQLYNDPAFLDAEIRRIRAGKAGDPIKPPVIRGKNTQQPKPSLGNETEVEELSEEGDGDEDDEDYSYSSEEIDVTCAPGKGWHARGQRCVLIHCPGGSSQRDFNTGECIHSFQPKGRYRQYSSWNSLKYEPAIVFNV